MAEKRDRRPRNEEKERDLIEEDVTDTNEDDDPLEDIESEDEDLDEDVIDEEASGHDRHFTRPIAETFKKHYLPYLQPFPGTRPRLAALSHLSLKP